MSLNVLGRALVILEEERAEWKEERLHYSISTELFTDIKLTGCGYKLKPHCHNSAKETPRPRVRLNHRSQLQGRKCVCLVTGLALIHHTCS